MGSDAQSVVVVGGGAAGFFAAIACAEANPAASVTLVEATAHPLAKVRVSGGGRCNVTHACFDPKALCGFYPRGGKELLGAFHRWQPQDTVDWFRDRGVVLKTEGDGRMFPITDTSATIVDCLMTAARNAGIELRLQTLVRSIAWRDDRFALALGGDEAMRAAKVVLATGGGRSSTGFEIARGFGHTIEPLVPSLFTFHIDDPRLKGAEARVEGTGLIAQGPALVTHWGLSGPAILKLSAWGAREFHARDYRFTLRLSWVGAAKAVDVRAALAAARVGHARQRLTTWNPWNLPSRLWDRIVATAGGGGEITWASAGNALLERLAEETAEAAFAVSGKSTNKEEFVTCGGVRLAEVDFRRMESKLRPGLHFAGETLDIDGVTGGFNFQSAWTTGRLAGLAAAS
jgi:predicted Rossmann fold flavoprotein